MQQRIREEDLRILRGEQDVDENGDFDEDMGGDYAVFQGTSNGGQRVSNLRP
jgi:hypothetical protein